MNHLLSLEQELNPKFFYTYAKNSAKMNAKIVSLIKNDVIISNLKRIAQVLRDQYDSVYSKPDDNCPLENPLTLFSTTKTESPSLTTLNFESQDLVTSIMQISNTTLLQALIYFSRNSCLKMRN